MSEKYIKFDIPEWVNWLARDSNADLFGYLNKPKKGCVSWYIGDVDVDQTNTCFVSNDMKHYPQVKWCDEEPKQFKDGITLHPYSSNSDDVSVDSAVTAIRNYGRQEDNIPVHISADSTDTVSADGLWRTPEDEPKGGLRNTLMFPTQLSEETEPDMIQNEAPDMVNTPPHYKQYSFEPIDIITEVVKEYPPEIGFHIGTTLKYLFRGPFKGNLPQDLQKAEYYLQRANKELPETDNKELTDE